MSTRCQIGFYKSADQPLDKPSALIYRHFNGYPDGEKGVLIVLIPAMREFLEGTYLEDASRAGAVVLALLMQQQNALQRHLYYEICGDHGLHDDLNYFYRVDPTGVTVYEVEYNCTFADLPLKYKGDHRPYDPVD